MGATSQQSRCQPLPAPGSDSAQQHNLERWEATLGAVGGFHAASRRTSVFAALGLLAAAQSRRSECLFGRRDRLQSGQTRTALNYIGASAIRDVSLCLPPRAPSSKSDARLGSARLAHGQSAKSSRLSHLQRQLLSKEGPGLEPPSRKSTISSWSFPPNTVNGAFYHLLPQVRFQLQRRLRLRPAAAGIHSVMKTTSRR